MSNQMSEPHITDSMSWEEKVEWAASVVAGTSCFVGPVMAIAPPENPDDFALALAIASADYIKNPNVPAKVVRVKRG